MPRLITPAERLLFPAPHVWVPMPRMAGYPCAPCCNPDCTWCNTPWFFAVTLGDIVNENCSDCGNLNDVFILRFNECLEFGASWYTDIAICNFDYIALTIQKWGATEHNAYVVVEYAGEPVPTGAKWRVVAAGIEPDCPTYDADLPFVGDNVDDCTFTNSTCHILGGV